jgi:predicted nucleotidyltransferase
MSESTIVNRKLLAKVIQRIIEVAHPDKLILFGSGARDEIGPHSDLDILVITQEPVHRGRLTEEIYLNLIGVGQAVDVIVATPEDVETYWDNPYIVIGPALREGKVIYERETSVAR